MCPVTIWKQLKCEFFTALGGKNCLKKCQSINIYLLSSYKHSLNERIIYFSILVLKLKSKRILTAGQM